MEKKSILVPKKEGGELFKIINLFEYFINFSYSQS